MRLVAEVIAEIDPEAGCEQLGYRLDGSIDPEVEVLGEPGIVGSPQLVGVATLDHPPSGRGLEQPGEEAVDRHDAVDATRDDADVPRGVGHSHEEAGPATSRRPTPRLGHRPAPENGACWRSSSRSSGVSMARARASRAAETS